VRSGAATYPAELVALRDSYARDLPDKAADVARAARRLAERWDGEGLEGLIRLVHRLTGSAAIYGFPDVSGAAADLESYLDSMRDRAAPRAIQRKRMLRLTTAFQEQCSNGR
jgi:HPt (histidine-containing phosphotransfer) domain-containing protein